MGKGRELSLTRVFLPCMKNVTGDTFAGTCVGSVALPCPTPLGNQMLLGEDGVIPVGETMAGRYHIVEL